jgi:phage-related protein (TIGR01555 family)
MAKAKAASKPKRVSKDGLQATDAFSNMLARIGVGSPSVAEGADYQLTRLSNDYQLMLTLYRNGWIPRRIVDEPAKDMVKAWPKITSKMDPEDTKLFDRCLARTGTKAATLKALKWSRLFGGAGALIVIKGHENKLDTPLDLDTVELGSYCGLIPFDRWSGISPSIHISTDIDDPLMFGLPEAYHVQATAYGGKMFDVHASRVLRFIGPDVPNPEKQAQSEWGISVVEVFYEQMKKLDNMSASIVNLMFRANILAQRDDSLSQMLSGAGSSSLAMQKFWQRMQAQNQLLSNQSTLILPKEGGLESHQYTFGGVADVYSLFQMDTAGAADMTVSWLFGRTATGLGQTNEFDVQYRNDKVAALQDDNLRPALEKLYPVILTSEFGQVPDDIDLDFPAVAALTQREKIELAKSGTESAVTPFTAGVYSQKTTLIRLRHLDEMLELPPSITDEMIEAADDDIKVMGDIDQADHESELAQQQAQEKEIGGKGAQKGQ